MSDSADHDHECAGTQVHRLVFDMHPVDRTLEKSILTELRKLVRLMATATAQLAALTTKVDDLVADVRAALAVINGDNLSVEAQAALDSLTAKVEAFDAEVGDADGSDTPPVV